jgi:hypothetical protein
MDDTLKAQWIEECLRLARRPSNIYASERKIIRNQRVTLTLDDSLSLASVGYTDRKGGMLEGLYLNEESRDAALKQWEGRKRGKFTSVAFHCFNHFEKRSGLVGTQGPCLTSVIVTDTTRGVDATIAYRSSEFFRKFPADLVFVRDVLMDGFGVSTVTFNFANVTVHPLYFPILIPLLEDPVSVLRDLQERDPRFARIVLRQAKDLLCGGKTNANFGQGQRVAKHALASTDPATLKKVQAYLRCPS